MISCCECGGKNIFSVKLDEKYLDYLKGLLERSEKHNISPEDKDFDRILKALASVSPPKDWKNVPGKN
jgi:hypothetical protein